MNGDPGVVQQILGLRNVVGQGERVAVPALQQLLDRLSTHAAPFPPYSDSRWYGRFTPSAL